MARRRPRAGRVPALGRAARAADPGTAFTAAADNWRKIAHLISDVIYERLTGEKGYFDTRDGLSSPKAARATNRIRRLAIMDQDGENHRYLTDGSYLVLTPRFHPDAQEITYMSYAGGEPKVYLFNIESGRQELLGNFPGMMLPPRFSPGRPQRGPSRRARRQQRHLVDGSRLAAQRRLTVGSGDRHLAVLLARTAAQIVFNSDRGGASSSTS